MPAHPNDAAFSFSRAGVSRSPTYKPVVLVRATGTGRIFDVDHVLRIQDYSRNLWPTTVAHDLPELEAHVRAGWENRESTDTYGNIVLGVAASAAA
jgi:hypothetical protein